MFQIILRLAMAALRALGVGARVGGPAIARFGRIAFTGLIRNRPLKDLTQQEIRQALAQAGMREAHNAHFVSRLVSRGPSFGINTLDDFARAVNNGALQVGKEAGTLEIVIDGGRAAIVVSERTLHLITFSGL